MEKRSTLQQQFDQDARDQEVNAFKKQSLGSLEKMNILEY
jgi:hypothetical protein